MKTLGTKGSLWFFSFLLMLAGSVANAADETVEAVVEADISCSVEGYHIYISYENSITRSYIDEEALDFDGTVTILTPTGETIVYKAVMVFFDDLWKALDIQAFVYNYGLKEAVHITVLGEMSWIKVSIPDPDTDYSHHSLEDFLKRL